MENKRNFDTFLTIAQNYKVWSEQQQQELGLTEQEVFSYVALIAQYRNNGYNTIVEDNEM